MRQAYANLASSVIVGNDKNEKSVEGITIFQNPQFGDVRVVMNPGNEPMFCLTDLCRVLALNPSKVAQRLSEDVLSKYPLVTVGGVQQTNFVNEDGLYDTILDSRKPEAKRFRKWITSEVLPSIRKTGQYSVTTPQTYAEALRRLADEVEARERTQLLLAEKTEQLDESKEWYSIKRWAKRHHKNWRNYSWRKLKAVSHELGYEVKKIFDSNFDEVNIYHRCVFEAVYGK